MKYVLIMFSILLVSGCAVKPFKYDVADFDKSSSVVVNDLRPNNEKEKGIFSYLITSDAYGIYRNADQVIDPEPLRLFQHRVYEKFSTSSSLQSVNVYHLVSYTNGKSAMRGAAMFGIIGVLAKNNSVDSSVSFVDREAFESSNDDEYKRALYSEEENPNKATVFVIYLDAEINGKREFIRKVSSVISKDGSNAYVTAVDSTILAFLSNY